MLTYLDKKVISFYKEVISISAVFGIRSITVVFLLPSLAAI